ncbi:MAG TPA: hypothetical protein VES01_07065 [Dermatophilaceae bacterium]|nr:hypothetical protein [Dermatophilaceae bacterium]
MRKPNTVVTGAVAITAAAAVAITGASFAFAGSGGETASSEPSGSGQPLGSVPVVGGNRYGSSGATSGPAAAGERGRHAHTEVIGETLAQVTAAVKGKEAGITVRRVLQDPDGSYDVFGTRADGTRVMAEVSKDLKSVEVRTGGPGSGMRGGMRGGHAHAAVTGEALAQVTAAVKGKDAGITVRRVLQDPDGSYHVVGTRADGTRVMVEVSKDLKSVEVRTGGPGMGKRTGALSGTTVTGDSLRKIAAAVKARDAKVTIRAALKLTDGTYWAVGSRADGTRVVASLNAKLEVTNLQTRPIGGQRGMRGDGDGDSGTRSTAPSTTPAAV